MLIKLLLSVVLPSEPVQVPVPLDVATAAFRSLVGRPGRRGSSLCLKVDGRDPTIDLGSLASIAERPLLPGSKCHYRQLPSRKEVAETLDGNPAEFLELSSFKRKSATEVEVPYQFRAGSWTGHGSALTLRLEAGQWQVQPHNGYEWAE
jgi:hypothetical protein